MSGDHYFISNLPFKMDYGTIRTFLTKKKIFPSKIIPAGKNAHIFFKTVAEGDEFMGRVNQGLKFRKNEISAKMIKDQRKEISRKSLKDNFEENMAEYEDELLKAVAPFYCMNYTDQLELKQKQVIDFFTFDLKTDKMLNKEALDQIGKINFLSIKSSPVIEGYRNKCEFTIGRGIKGMIEVGFRLSGHCKGVETMSPSCCPTVSPIMKEIARLFSEYLIEIEGSLDTLTIFDPINNSGHLKLLIVREVKESEIMIIFVMHRQQLSDNDLIFVKQDLIKFVSSIEFNVKSVHLAILESNNRQFSHDVPTELLMGDEHIIECISDMEFEISPNSFFQINTSASEILFNSVAELVLENREEGDFVLLDLCCGTGTFGIILSKLLNPLKTVGIELCTDSVKNARVNSLRNNVENIEFIAEDVRSALPRVLAEMDCKAVVVLDPPRSGVHKDVISSIRGQPHITTLVFVSCAISKARLNIVDLLRKKSNKMLGTPFTIKHVLPVDMFPQTCTSEVILYMTRK